jgi:DNA end-binding protein Ku
LPEYDDQENASTRPFWSGTITFGLVSIPVNLFPAKRSSRVSLRLLGPKGKPLNRRYYSEKTGRNLSDSEIVRGYQIEDGRYIVVTDEELDRVAPEKSRDIDLRRFVDAASIPPVYFERSYFLAPAGGSAKAYRLLAQTMEETGKAGIATFVMRGKEYLVAIFSEAGILRAETLRFLEEVRAPEEIGLPGKRKPVSREVRKFEKIIAGHSADKLPRNEMRDQAAGRLLKLIEKKRARDEDMVRAGRGGRKKAEIVDMVTVLQRALSRGEGKGSGSRAGR